MSTFSMPVVTFHYIFQIYIFFPSSQRSLQIPRLLWTAGSTSKSWSIGLWYKDQPTNLVHQDHFDTSLLSTRCPSEIITEDVGWWCCVRGCLWRIVEKSERRIARIHLIRESWYSDLTYLSSLMSSPGCVLGQCAAECERGFSWSCDTTCSQ